LVHDRPERVAHCEPASNDSVADPDRVFRSLVMRPELADVYDDHVWDVYGFFAYRLGSRQEAEDLTQGTFERALKAWNRFDPSRSSPRTWLLAIANNLLIDHFRADRSGRNVPIGEDGVGEESLPVTHGPEANDLGVSPELAAAIASLGDRARHILALRYGGDLTGPEIAELLGLSLANVQQILSRSLRRMRTLLEADRVSAG
jgi:RNA polymerase sigma-70 factor (ECF subfamily)